MPLPKRRHSSTRRDKRRTHDSLKKPILQICKTTGNVHRPHTAYIVNGKLYYNGKIVADYEAEADARAQEKARIIREKEEKENAKKVKK